MPILQFDNWEFKPLHAVKVDGNPMPKLNVSLMQVQAICKKRQTSTEDFMRLKRTLCDGWKDVSRLGNREELVQKYTSSENTEIHQQFNFIAFGLVALYGAQLIGESKSAEKEYNTRTVEQYSFGAQSHALDFRTLLLSAFNPHGGRDQTDDNLFDRKVVYIEVSQDKASDIITVGRFLNLLQDKLKPCTNLVQGLS